MTSELRSCDPLPISLVAHTAFCERRAWLEAAGEIVEDRNIEIGVASHERVDQASSSVQAWRSLDISHVDLGIVGKCDVVNQQGSLVEIVEFKATPGKRKPTVSRANRLQLALQRMCLERVGIEVASQRIYFTNHRRSVDVELGTVDFQEAVELVERTRRLLAEEHPPEPLVDDPRCRFCSHVAVCLPNERRMAKTKRVVASDPHGDTLHLTTPGSRAFLRQGRVLVVRGDEELASIPLERVSAIVVQGNVDLSSALIREAFWRRLTVVWASGTGRVVGYGRTAKTANGLGRRHQIVQSQLGSARLAAELIAPKIANQATQLRRNGDGIAKDVVALLRSLSRQCVSGTTVRELFAIEGRAAAIYFENFGTMVRADQGWLLHWPGRYGKGATDPMNVALNYCYGLLLAEVVRAILACGMDPHMGFAHSSNRNKPALALDLMEQFRPVIADSAVLGAVNNRELSLSMFYRSIPGSTRLTDKGRKALTAAYERRVAHEFRHPVFGYLVSWRRAIEVQARMLLGHLEGSQDRYVGVRTR